MMICLQFAPETNVSTPPPEPPTSTGTGTSTGTTTEVVTSHPIIPVGGFHFYEDGHHADSDHNEHD